ncbi:alpha/beta hydrolase [Streptosporangium sp. NBC_01755]|uniref:alpha/beta hydrolase n=1 Tax=unclassified Streptosporangium TaxID=2632669 RepID=UPI002DDB39AB|nr:MULTISPECIES: alpha/beta hydrolase [unclassified Streptosporangium]WSA27874.1 alpha/beta hydrolase [Streptosporangium sp. NBC_01810]WSD00654.1 alpha/beta hydrolase [Streptosporangium sp. NBC_01755]
MIPPSLHVPVVIGPGLVADLRLLTEVADREFAALGVSGTVSMTSDLPGFRAALDSPGALVVLPGPDPGARGLFAERPEAVWLDVTKSEAPLPGSAGGALGTHLHGRGIWGLTWAIRHAVHRLRRPAHRVAYGDHPDQWAEIRPPYGTAGQAPSPEADGQTPVAVLLHGGFWRSIWGADLMDALAVDLAERGFAAWNLEYRRPDLHGWDATTADVARGIALAAQGARGPLVVIGHSAGGQLALRAAADDAAADDRRITLAVSLAGVLDLAEGDRRHMSSGAVAAALGGSVAEVPETYLRSGPLERLPLVVPQLIVQGTGDDLDLVDFGRRYARAAQESGDQVIYLEMSGDHFDVIEPASPIWRATAEAMAEHCKAT